MKKGMQVLTTHYVIFKALHGRTCNGEHVHQPIEGSTTVQGETMLRTKYTEVYPRKFARLIAKTMSQSKLTWPFQWQHGMLLAAEESEALAFAGRSTSVLRPRAAATNRSNFARSQLLTPLDSQAESTKRRRLDGKQSARVDLEICQSLFQDLQSILPRVGRREIQETEVLQKLQQIFPDKRVVTAVACRGTDRTMGPPEHLQGESAPFRRTIMILRPSGTIQYEKEWEKWDQLSHRQLIRPAHACRINCTVFAQDNPEVTRIPNPISPQETPSDESVSEPHDPEQSSGSDQNAAPLDETSPLPAPTDDSASSAPAQRGSETCPNATTNPMSDQVLEISRKDQTSEFQALPKWEQSQLLLMHRNLGHPSNERFAKALQANGQRPEMVRAAAELKCSVCAANAAPKHQRPSRLKELLDFNYRIYLDGIKWTSRTGESFQFYHIVDAGTHFHVAFIAPAHTSKDVISLIHQHWINWAGSPQELKVDSGTELNSEEFAQFAQRMSIKCMTTCPEAHWQNGTIERHGSFLQHMLSKIDLEMPIKNYRDLQVALNQCTQAKNSMVVHRGYSPEIMVFGKQSRLPGSVLSDLSIPAHTAALQEEHDMSAESFRQQLKIRELARQAFHMADNSDALRKSFLRRSCPSRGHYQKGQWVMIWRNMGPQKKGWIGPQRVILQDGNHTVWSTVGGKLYRSAPENTRLSLPEEGQPTGPELPDDLTQMQQQINRITLNQPLQPIPEDEIITSNPNVTPVITPDNPEITHQPSNGSESLAQPDHEPEVDSRRESIHDHGSSDQLEEALFYTCHEPACALMEADPNHYAWKCEYEVNTPEEFLDQNPNDEEAWLLLATQSKKQKCEVRLSELTESERQEFAIAKQSEVSNWLKTETLTKMLRDQVPHDQILRCRWILTWKPLDPSDHTANQGRTHKAKARIVVLGYMDPQIEEIPRDSPTLSRTSRMLILQLIASHSWKLQSFDIKAAFLQGQPQENRLIAVDPVNELREALKLNPNEITRLNKSAYGLIDAPYLWYCALVQELTRLGMEACPFDPCVFVLWEDSVIPSGDEPAPKRQTPAQGAIVGILGVHVDDGIGGGNAKFQQVLQRLEAKFAFGSKKASAFTFTGIDVTQHGDHSISLCQSNYIRKITPIPIDIQRKTQPNLTLNDKEKGHLRGLVGSLQYASTNTRPDLANRLSNLQSSINSGTIETLMEANRLLHEAKRHHDVTITIKSIPHENVRFMTFSDASFASHNKPNSYAGSITVATHQDISKNTECPISSPLMWGSKKIQRVVTSTLSAETASLATALDQLSWLRLYWKWLHDPKTEWNKPEEALCKVEPAISVTTIPHETDLAVTDCKSLYDLITRTAPPSCSEFRVQLVARSIKEILREGINLRWVHTGAQLADCLTKAMEARFLRETLRHGFYKLHDESATLKERAKTRDRIQWLKQQSSSTHNKSDNSPSHEPEITETP
jgi:hypothetical protein